VDVMIVVVGRERRLYYIVTQTVCLYLVVLLDTLLPRVLTQEKERKVAAKFKLFSRVSTMIEAGSGLPLQPTKISRDTITEWYFPNKTLQLPV
jgi:hypothetical protein